MSNYKYGFNDKPKLLTAIPLSAQHVFAAFGGTMSSAILIATGLGMSIEETGLLIQSAMLIAGISTIVQSMGIGSVGAKLPIVTAATFTFIGPYIALGSNPDVGISGMFGAALVSGLFLLIIGPFIVKYLHKFFTPVVTGSVVLSVGLCLVGTTFDQIVDFNPASPDLMTNLLIAGITFAVIMLLNQFGKGFIKVSAVIIGMLAGFLIAIFLGRVDFQSVSQASLVSVPKPLNWGMTFNVGAIVTMCILHVTTIMEVIGDVTGVTGGVENRIPTQKELVTAIRGDGFGSTFAAIFNGLPVISGSPNIGIICMTGVASRYITALGGVMFCILAFFPKISQVLALTPNPVLGGALLAVFGTISASGIKIISMDNLNNRNITILGLALAIGIGGHMNQAALAFLPDIVVSIATGIPGTALVALILNVILPKEKEE